MAAGSDGRRRAGRRRTAAVVVLLVLGTVLTPAALVGHWVRSTIFDTTGYVNAVAPLAGNPRVQAAVAAELTTALLGGAQLSPPTTALLTPLVRTSVRAVVAAHEFAKIWRTTNRVAHRQIRLFLTNKSEFLRSTGGQVTIPIADLLAPVRTVVRNELPTDVRDLFDRIPATTTNAQLVLIDSPSLARAQTELAVANEAAWVLPIAAAVTMLTAIALSHRRRSTTVAVGALVATSGALLLGGLTIVRKVKVARAATSTAQRGLLTAVFDGLTAPLAHAAIVTCLCGLLLALAAASAGWLGRLGQ